MYIAHITNLNGERCEQGVFEHCRNTAVYAGEALETVGLYNSGYFVGLIHDIGKMSHLFNDYITRAFNGEDVSRGTINHTFAAVIFILESYHTENNTPMEKLAAEIMAYAAASHHGLIDLVDTESKSGFLHRLQKDKAEICYDEVIHAFGVEFSSKTELDELFQKAVSEITDIFRQIKEDCIKYKFNAVNRDYSNTSVKYICGMLSRLILSALIDGDRRDTAEFMCGEKFSFIKADKVLWESQLDCLNDKIKNFSADTPINQARKYISDTAYNFAEKSGGIYRITVPTGAGKTLSTLRYALNHAFNHNKRRLIFTIPLLSVLEQNAAVIKDYIKDKDIITEHHSNVVKINDDKEKLNEYELLAQTWETPVLVTTLVQLLNTLFSGKTTAVRRMKALCNSVIVIDEVQTVPYKMLYMFNEAINFLVYYCGATVVLSSATQPCFEEVKFHLSLTGKCDIVPYNAELFSAFKRTEIIDKCTPYGMSLDELADFSSQLIEENRSLLVICNTKKTALNLYKQLKLMCGCKVYHLSTSMCMKHRIDTLKEINYSLDKKEKIICVSTQLVEAGVDFSFESCIRIKAGMDNIAQAAGRCNRSNDYGHICNVYIVSLRGENLSRLKEIQTAQNCTNQLLYCYSADKERYKNDLLSNESVSEYYKLLFGQFVNESVFAYPANKRDSLFYLLGINEDYLRSSDAGKTFIFNQAFKAAGQLFKVFDDNTIDVIVPYNDEAKKIIADLCSSKAKFDLIYLRNKIEEAKPYTIQIYTTQVKDKEYMLYPSNSYFTALHSEYYNSETGLDDNNIIF